VAGPSSPAYPRSPKAVELDKSETSQGFCQTNDAGTSRPSSTSTRGRNDRSEAEAGRDRMGAVDLRNRRRHCRIVRMINTPFRGRSAVGWSGHLPGAQTERRGGAGRVSALLGRRDSPAAFHMSVVIWVRSGFAPHPVGVVRSGPAQFSWAP